MDVICSIEKVNVEVLSVVNRAWDSTVIKTDVGAFTRDSYLLLWTLDQLICVHCASTHFRGSGGRVRLTTYISEILLSFLNLELNTCVLNTFLALNICWRYIRQKINQPLIANRVSEKKPVRIIYYNIVIQKEFSFKNYTFSIYRW